MAAHQAPPSRTDEDLLLFQLRLGQVSLNESFPGFPLKAGVIIPLGELCRELELGIQVDPATGVADGFLIEESRKFHLDARKGTLTVGTTTRTLDRSLLEIRPDDIYLDTQLLAQCLSLTINLGLRSSVITIVPREPLPLQERWKREGGAGYLQQGPRPKTFAPMTDPYRLFEFPALDLTLGLTTSKPSPGSRPFTAQGSALAAGDLLGLTTNLFASAQNPGGLMDFHMAMGRNDPHAGLMGPLKATAFALGEVLNPGLSLATLPRSGTGAMVTNIPVQADNAFDRHSFKGDLAPGWQVELYQNQALLAFQASRPDGRYEFLNVPLTFGWNDFTLVFYGPQGQRREEVVHFDVSQSQTPTGAFYYQAVHLDTHGGLGPRSQFQTSYGLSRQFSAAFGATRILLDGVDHTYTQASLQGYWSALAGGLTAGTDSHGGAIAELALRSRLGFLSLAGKETVLKDGYQSEAFQPTYGPILRRTSLQASAALPSLRHTWGTLELGDDRDRLVSGGTADTYHGRLSTALGGCYASGFYTRTETHGLPFPGPVLSTGEVLLSKQILGLGLRGQASYNLTEGHKLESYSLTADLTRFPPTMVQAGLGHTVRDGANTFSLGASKTQGAYSLGANLGYSTKSGLSANVTFRLGLAREPRERHLFTHAQGTTAFGAVSVEAFLDANGNGRRDPGEKPLPNLAFTVNGVPQATLTDAQGVAFLQGLPQDTDAHIALNAATLDDPLMRPAIPGARVTPRGGHVVRMEVPVILFGEVNGTTYLLKDGKRTELPGLRLELRDEAGQVIKSLRTAYDGFYTFTDLQPGTYRLEVPGAATKALGAPALAPRIIRLAPEGTLLDGVDVVVAVPAG
jgi:hypothetical protein